MTNNHSPNTSNQNKKKTLWAFAIATFFGAGYGKPGPGTWGSVAAVLLWGAYAWGLRPTPGTLFLILLAGIALSIVVGVPAATIVALCTIDDTGVGPHRRGCRSVDCLARLSFRSSPRGNRPRPLPPLRHHQALPGPSA